LIAARISRWAYSSRVPAACNTIHWLVMLISTQSQDRNGWNALHVVAENGRPDLVKLLLYSQAYNASPDIINAQDRYGRTPLHIACENDNIPIAQLLISSNAQDSLKNKVSLHQETRVLNPETLSVTYVHPAPVSLCVTPQLKDGNTALELLRDDKTRKLLKGAIAVAKAPLRYSIFFLLTRGLAAIVIVGSLLQLHQFYVVYKSM